MPMPTPPIDPALMKHEQERAGVESYPEGLLTMIVLLEAIFLSTFVMISQNRADAKRQVIADEQWRTVQEEDQQNKELLELSRQILRLTKEARALAGKRRCPKPLTRRTVARRDLAARHEFAIAPAGRARRWSLGELVAGLRRAA